jgi:hypothetical protein
MEDLVKYWKELAASTSAIVAIIILIRSIIKGRKDELIAIKDERLKLALEKEERFKEREETLNQQINDLEEKIKGQELKIKELEGNQVEEQLSILKELKDRKENLENQKEKDKQQSNLLAPDIQKLISKRLLDRIDISKYVGYWKGEAVSFDMPEFNTPTKEMLKWKKSKLSSNPRDYDDIIGKFSGLDFNIEYKGNNLFKYWGNYFKHNEIKNIKEHRKFEGLGYGYVDNINFFYIHDKDDIQDVDETVSFGSFLLWVEKNDNVGTGLWTIVSSRRNMLTAGKTDVRRVSKNINSEIYE